MAKSARKTLTAEKTVTVANVKQVTEELAVISYVEDNVRYDDLYNVASKEVMDTLLSTVAGKKVEATIAPDSSEDADGHPECIAAEAV